MKFGATPAWKHLLVTDEFVGYELLNPHSQTYRCSSCKYDAGLIRFIRGIQKHNLISFFHHCSNSHFTNPPLNLKPSNNVDGPQDTWTSNRSCKVRLLWREVRNPPAKTAAAIASDWPQQMVTWVVGSTLTPWVFSKDFATLSQSPCTCLHTLISHYNPPYGPVATQSYAEEPREANPWSPEP